MSEHPTKTAVSQIGQGTLRQDQKISGTAKALKAATEAADNQVTLALVSQYIDRPITSYRLPPLITHFLSTHWRSHLAKAHLASGGSESRRWLEAIKTMEDLIWSVHPKKDVAPRRRLFALLPQLYQRLHAGLESLGLDKTEQDSFFAELAKLHQTALHPGKSSDDLPPPPGA